MQQLQNYHEVRYHRYDNNESVFDNSNTTVSSSSPPHSPILQNHYYNKQEDMILSLTTNYYSALTVKRYPVLLTATLDKPLLIHDYTC